MKNGIGLILGVVGCNILSILVFAITVFDLTSEKFENECGEQKYISVEDDWLVENNLDIGSEWPEL